MLLFIGNTGRNTTRTVGSGGIHAAIRRINVLGGVGLIIYNPNTIQLSDPFWRNLTVRSLTENAKTYFPKMQWKFSFGFTFQGDPYFCCSEITPNPLNLIPDRGE